ncbi:MAG: hypothetical protein JKY80_05680 [Mariprofundaceae bacterium]|nr:hypothetical protein [Mariprofundaceae bacterium]
MTMVISSPSQPQSAFDTIINPLQAPSNSPSTSVQATDQVSISAAAKAMASSEINESPMVESTEVTSTQVSEGETGTSKSLNIIA